MNEPGTSKIAQLRIDPAAKRRSTFTVKLVFIVVALVVVGALVVWRPWVKETARVSTGGGKTAVVTERDEQRAAAATSRGGASRVAQPTNSPAVTARPAANADSLLTVSGYIVNRERIEISPRFMGVVKWIGVRKGDAVTNGQVVVLLDDAEYQARKRELEGRIAQAQVAIRRAEVELRRTADLAREHIEPQRSLELAQLDVAAAQAQARALEGELQLVNTYIEWTVIRSPITGVVLEKLVDANELVTPQSFGGTRGPSTAFISVGDPQDLQVEIDLNEADLSKVFLGQKCRVSPEAYLDRSYAGLVVEVAPEASRQKGTLQIKVQIKDPDKFLTPELSARVDFLKPDA